MPSKNVSILLLISLFVLSVGVGPVSGNRAIKVGVYQNYPLTFIEEDGTVRGFFIDILEYVAKKENWTIEYVPGVWSECLKDLKNGRLDLLGVIAYSEQRDSHIDYTYESVLTEWAQVYVSEGSRIESILDLKDKKVAVLHDDMHFANLRSLIAQFGIQCRFVEAVEYEDILMLVQSGRCQAGLVSNFYGNQYARNYRVKRTPIVLSPERLYFATPEGTNRELLDALDSELRKLKAQDGSFYHNSMGRWLELGAHTVFDKWLGWGIFGALAFMMVFLSTSMILRAKVKSKTIELVEKNLELTREIDQRKTAEEALGESEEKFSKLFETSPIWMVLATLGEGRYVEVNEAFIRDTGYLKEEVLGRRATDFGLWPDPVQRDQVIHYLMETGSLDAYPIKFRMKDGSVRDFLWSARVVDFNEEPCTLSGLIDVTDRVKSEKEKERLLIQLEQVRRYEAIGTLAGGIAHDFNNLLMGIQGNISLALQEIHPDTPVGERLRNIESYIQNATDLTKQLLGFARGGKYEVKASSINQLIEKSAVMFGRTKKEISLQLDLERPIWTVEIDRGQIEQVLLNLFVNAWQAMPEGGDLHIQTRNITLQATHTKQYVIHPGPYVKIDVSDTGVGMDERVQKRIFDPFFTTKEKGRGTGLGLASAYGIIKNHHGYIEVYSRKGEGTRVSIFLPASEKEVVTEKPVREKIDRGSGSVMLVDDEQMVLDVGREMLQRLGFTVTTAASGREALRIFEASPDRIDLVILDLIMPHMSGGETYDRIREADQEVKVLLASGYSLDGHAKQILDRGCSGFIQKPFNMEQLSNKISEVLKTGRP
ncbi:PAS/PAC sensor hybrid histidine kinase [Olavius algarvensis associated proteobacterium Delta 3]|nr:PAS/PAC sensor hybrid histidine kinase [Olavius algarvensis associated proteobacterium Delta 3]CAB5169211.1 PAS/PAC sensor hybrid histidine kinase [Olavius algarvensis associated proteobacterium Delta 3]